MYSKEELLIFSIINSKCDIGTQNLINKIFKFSNKENLNFFSLNNTIKKEVEKAMYYLFSIKEANPKDIIYFDKNDSCK